MPAAVRKFKRPEQPRARPDHPKIPPLKLVTRIEEGFDWKAPDYVPIFRERAERLLKMRADPQLLANVKKHYKDGKGGIADFLNDWGVVFEPRNVERNLPAIIPFILFPRQREFVDWMVDAWRSRENRQAEKSRDMGVSFLTVDTACALCCFHEGMAIGFGSRKEEYVDKLDSPKSLFWKARLFMRHLPEEFRPGWDERQHAPHMRMKFPWTGSFISGESGDGIGRGDRTGIHVVDESAYLEHPETTDASLSQTTNCVIHVSSANGTANPFYERRKRWVNTRRLFTFHWRSDPRKDQAWYDAEVEEIGNPVIVAQELDIDYSASVEGVLIPSAWVQAAVDAHVKMGWEPSGRKRAALDVADGGPDANAFVGGCGNVLLHAEDWSGAGDDGLFATAERAFRLCDELGYDGFDYDADGLGAGVKGDSNVINGRRRLEKVKVLRIGTFRGSGAIVDPEKEDVKGRKNKDMFVNAKAQRYWRLRGLFQKTYRAATARAAGQPSPHQNHELISLSSAIPPRTLDRLTAELSQPQYLFRPGDGKMLINKAPDGASSPNFADGVMIWSGGGNRNLVITDELLRKTGAPAAVASAAYRNMIGGTAQYVNGGPGRWGH